MQQLTINVPDNKVAFFRELSNNLGFAIESNIMPVGLSDSQIELVKEARRDIIDKPELFLDWEEAKKTIKFD